MKEILREIIDKPIEMVTLEALMNCFEVIKDNGDIGLIKFDGLRESSHYTVVVTIPSLDNTHIRMDDSSLKNAVIKVLVKYYKLKYDSN